MKKGKYVIMLLVLLADQIVKAMIRGALSPGESMDFLGSFMSLTYVQNTGAAFSMLRGMTWLLVLVPAILVVLGIGYMEKHDREHWSLYLGLALVIGGGVSNLIDRVAAGFVTDMFDVHFWPVFNVADIAICVGCGIFIIYILRYHGKAQDEL